MARHTTHDARRTAHDARCTARVQPTNHLDAETIDALVVAIRDFKGGVLVVSHDQHLLSEVCEDLWLVADGGVRKYRGTFADYKKAVLAAVK